jgi:hypothetical protein
MSDAGKTRSYGPEPWTTTQETVWSHWDLWFCLVALADHDGDLEKLTEAIENGGRLSGAGTAEAKLSHLDDLKHRLSEASVDAGALAAGEEADPRVLAMAQTKVLKQGLYPRDTIEPMRHSPRQRLYERALRGRWQAVPGFRRSRSTSASINRAACSASCARIVSATGQTRRFRTSPTCTSPRDV